jgi:hypothetical protein
MQSGWPWREHQHVKLLANQAEGLVALFPIVVSNVLANERRVPFKAQSKSEGNAPLGQISCVFGRIEGHNHIVYCTHINRLSARAATQADAALLADGQGGSVTI